MKILIAEDDVATRNLLEQYLTAWGYDIISAPDGHAAWEAISGVSPPSIVIIDWMMPGLDGLEICERIRKSKFPSYCYIIMLTGKDSKENISAGLDAGADDYIIKPFEKNELKSRLAAGKRIAEYEKKLIMVNEELTQYTQKLEQMAEEKAKQLAHADRMTLLGTMTAGIAHEINNPTASIRLNAETLKEFWKRILSQILSSYLQDHPDDKVAKMAYEDGEQILEDIDTCTLKIKKIVDNMRRFSHSRDESIINLDLARCIQDSLSICIAKIKRLTIKKDLAAISRVVRGNSVKITQVLVNLISNAADALEDTADPVIKISLIDAKTEAIITVRDNGNGMSEETCAMLGKAFFTTKPVGKGTGLGLSISYGIILDDQKGKIEVSSTEGKGSTFTVHLPYFIEQSS